MAFRVFFVVWLSIHQKSLLLQVVESPDLEVPCPAPHPGHRGGPFWSVVSSCHVFFFSFAATTKTARCFLGSKQKPFHFRKKPGKTEVTFCLGLQREEVIVCNIPSLLWLRWHSEEWCNLPRPNPLEIVFFPIGWLAFWSSFMSQTVVFLGLFAWSVNAFRTWKTLTGESAHTGPRGPAWKTRLVNHTVLKISRDYQKRSHLQQTSQVWFWDGDKDFFKNF